MQYRRNAQVRRQWRLLLALSDREWFTVDQLRDCLPAIEAVERMARTKKFTYDEQMLVDRFVNHPFGM